MVVVDCVVVGVGGAFVFCGSVYVCGVTFVVVIIIGVGTGGVGGVVVMVTPTTTT